LSALSTFVCRQTRCQHYGKRFQQPMVELAEIVAEIAAKRDALAARG
jgi:hypothetical protein